MDFVLNNSDLIDIIASNMEFDSLMNMRLTCKKFEKCTKKQYIKSISKYSKFNMKKMRSSEKIYKLMVDNELEFVSENIDHIDEPIDFETFVKEVHDNDVLYNLLIISSNSQNEFDEKIRTLYADFMEDFIDIWD
jgi:hypothetical protein